MVGSKTIISFYCVGRTARVALKNAEKFAEIVNLPVDLIVDLRRMIDALSSGKDFFRMDGTWGQKPNIILQIDKKCQSLGPTLPRSGSEWPFDQA